MYILRNRHITKAVIVSEINEGTPMETWKPTAIYPYAFVLGAYINIGTMYIIRNHPITRNFFNNDKYGK